MKGEIRQAFLFILSRKEVTEIKPSLSEQKRVQHQYDALAKKVLAGEAKNYDIELAKRGSREVLFSELGEIELEQLLIFDQYSSDYNAFRVAGFDVLIKDDLLSDALYALPAKNRKVVLLSYFLDMSDKEIADILHVVRSTVFRQRKKALEKIKTYMEGKDHAKNT